MEQQILVIIEYQINYPSGKIFKTRHENVLSIKRLNQPNLTLLEAEQKEIEV